MHNMFLATTLTIYVGGLVTFMPDVPEKGTLRLVLLSGNAFVPWHHHMKPVASHEPYLVADAGDVCFATNAALGCSDQSKGHKVSGGLGGQLARFQLSDGVALNGSTPNTSAVVLSGAKLAPVGYGVEDTLCSGVKPQAKLRANRLDNSWPVEAWVDLKGIDTVDYDKRRLRTVHLLGDGCTTRTIDIADRILVKINTNGSTSPTFAWTRNGHREQAVLNTKATQVSLWNLPKPTDVAPGDAHTDHFEAYFSLLEDKKACHCTLGADHVFVQDSGEKGVITSAEPAFCPPSEEHP